MIDTARLLAASGHGKPSQVNLRRSVSTAYYALFHAMARNCADLLIGGAGSERSKHAWIEVYRSVAHGNAKAACADGQTMPKFPSQIIDFANQFVEMQKKRHDADYNPYAKFYKSAVLNDISSCELVIKGFATAGVKDRRAFASWVILKNIKRN